MPAKCFLSELECSEAYGRIYQIDNDLEIELAYYPTYDSNHTILFNVAGEDSKSHWSGTLLNSIETTLEWAKTMTWKRLKSIVKLLETTYEKGLFVCKLIV